MPDMAKFEASVSMRIWRFDSKWRRIGALVKRVLSNSKHSWASLPHSNSWLPFNSFVRGIVLAAYFAINLL
ncbi:unnamed protein product [Periconia digitata]|uniref:Uncharacterized protein n=1 Tax=Periconia digitata TaxID=1303443 RepID=A0A9W4XEA0_9PLEO|nr:unnamed protein product [Periconia digitata]